MTRREALEAATPYLRHFAQALRLGRLRVCCQCGQYAWARDPEHLGRCGRYEVEAWPFAPAPCEGFERRRAA